MGRSFCFHQALFGHSKSDSSNRVWGQDSPQSVDRGASFETDEITPRAVIFKRQIIRRLCFQKCFKLPENRVTENTFCFEVLTVPHLLMGCYVGKATCLQCGEGANLDSLGGPDWGICLPRVCAWPLNCLGFTLRQSAGNDRH